MFGMHYRAPITDSGSYLQHNPSALLPMTCTPRLHTSHLLILDRDGVLGLLQTQVSPQNVPVWQAQPDVLEAIAWLNRGGWHVAITASPCTPEGHALDMVTLNTLHSNMHQQLAAAGARADAVFICPAANTTNSTNSTDSTHALAQRVNLLRNMANRYGMDTHRVHVLCQTVAEAQCAASAGCVPHVLHPLQKDGKAIPSQPPVLQRDLPYTHWHDDITACVQALLAPASEVVPCTP